MALNRPRVYNHYNRVRANMSHMFDTAEDTIMGEIMIVFASPFRLNVSRWRYIGR